MALTLFSLKILHFTIYTVNFALSCKVMFRYAKTWNFSSEKTTLLFAFQQFYQSHLTLWYTFADSLLFFYGILFIFYACANSKCHRTHTAYTHDSTQFITHSRKSRANAKCEMGPPTRNTFQLVLSLLSLSH